MKLGASVYLHVPIEEQLPYLEKINEYGFQTLFTSLHIPEDDVSLYAERLKRLGRFAEEKGMALVCDVSPQSMAHLQLTWENASLLRDWGVTGLRIDYGMEAEIVADISRSLAIIVNASTVKAEDIAALKQAGVSFDHIEGWHNFYPRPETGLGRENFNNMNERLQQAGFKRMAFIPGDGKRGPLYEGLPTLEAHRRWSPFAAWLDLYSHKAVDTVIVGDPQLNESSLQQLAVFQQQGVILLRAKAYVDVPPIIDKHCNRPDEARDVIRSVQSRGMAQQTKQKVKPNQTIERLVGSITMDNERYGRYQGEIQLTKRDLQADAKVNVIGRVIEEDRPLLNYLKANQPFCIKWI
ncbi:outer surface protein [Bacillus sp. JCM 19047]|uniref:DUF871 domain-containing protein n=1 Tax=Shouchella miscanthi TaxID=2598861 RepID=UPI0003EFF652|nr:MupG family TIM beta-alpha barrel fold protein [Shouchella miscanthi]GAF21575.1 outer surface protein [Bacillus sp. JCM 19047]